MPSLKEVFTLLERAHPNYEHRPGQMAMAEAVAQALAGGEHLCVEAGTGTGKSLAYLIPALLSGKKTVVSTATKNLQEQLYFKDIPFIRQHLLPGIRVCVMKGRGNYLCLKKMHEFALSPSLLQDEETEFFKRLQPWAERTETGDRADLDFVDDHTLLWRAFDARRDTCVGQKCAQFDSCFVTRVRKQALEADLTIVNHSLFFADLALRNEDIGGVLPRYSVAILDEAHEIESIATEYFGRAVSSFRIAELLHDAAALARQAPHLQATLDKLETRRDDLLSAAPASEGRYLIDDADLRGKLTRAGGPFCETLRLLETQLAHLAGRSEDWSRLYQRTGELRDDLNVILNSDDIRSVSWCERARRGVFLHLSPLELGPLLAQTLFASVRSVILTSATLTVENNFQFLRERLGLRKCSELALQSEFDYQTQAILYVPRQLPEPGSPQFPASAAREITRILKITQGRAFLLFTSYQQMERLYSILQQSLPYPLLKQGDKPRSALLERFRKTPHSVLFATSSFWQGVDVAGETLSCVIIDRLPFAVPTDPLVASRCRYIESTGGDPFYDYSVPDAVIALKQGLGRLIRSRNDRGILAVLDRRILCKSYGSVFVKSLPKCKLTDNISDLSNFFRQG